MRKFIHSDFELDLSGFSITDTAENPWFTGEYFSKYSYPFTFLLDDETDIAMGMVSNHNSADAVTLFKGTYVDGNVMEEAELELEEIEDTASLSLRYGLDDFPNFETKLANLPLYQAEVASIYEHAADVISLGWPAVKYNFPQVHIDKIDTSADEWASFQKIINNYQGGAFLINEVDLETETSINRNIMQPLPYLLHILQAGFLAAGKTLSGDILTFPLFQKILLYADCEYYNTIAQESIDVIYTTDDYDTIDYTTYNPRVHLMKTLDIENPGKYRITGDVKLIPMGNFVSNIRIKYRDTLLFSLNTGAITLNQPVDVTFETLTDLNANYLTFEYDGGSINDVTDTLFNLSVNPVRLHDESGNAITSIINLNEVNLKRAVPDMTFGDLVKLCLEMFKMNLDTSGSEARMNFIEDEIEASEIIDMSRFEVKRPKRIFSKGNSYLVKYEDVNDEKYMYDVIFQDASGPVTSGYTETEKTTQVTFNALPLPLLYRNNVLTAHGFLEDDAKPMFILYNGMVSGKNIAQDPAPLYIPALHEQFLEKWLQQRIDAAGYEWSFRAYTEELEGLTAKSRVHAYGNIHIVKQIEKTSVKPGLYEVRLTTEVFKQTNS
ncbi:hypothetical protein ACLI1A_10055 [Flavobacterium sp. RHBU_3]|uniref:hypothetical protein n=1 Tax=Flavobacterium sp. RHBU_3 TaxID=3391184 RepID=UPI003984A37C